MSFNNGKINPTVCTAEQDSVASMNLKRAIASALQVSLVQAGHPSTIFEVRFFVLLPFTLIFNTISMWIMTAIGIYCYTTINSNLYLLKTDNQGTCNTTYHTSWSDTIVVTKQKDLTQCTGHDKIILSELSSSQSKPVRIFQFRIRIITRISYFTFYVCIGLPRFSFLVRYSTNQNYIRRLGD